MSCLICIYTFVLYPLKFSDDIGLDNTPFLFNFANIKFVICFIVIQGLKDSNGRLYNGISRS